jgi:acyl CoA:acetate/3-ketoacid CoA transferase
MKFKPEVSPKLREMDRMLFLKQKMGIRDSLFDE